MKSPEQIRKAREFLEHAHMHGVQLGGSQAEILTILTARLTARSMIKVLKWVLEEEAGEPNSFGSLMGDMEEVDAKFREQVKKEFKKAQ